MYIVGIYRCTPPFQIHSFPTPQPPNPPKQNSIHQPPPPHPPTQNPKPTTTGNTFVLKPSERDPGAALLLAEMAQEAGLPDGVLNLVHGGAPTVDFLCDAPEVKVSGCGGVGCAYTTARATPHLMTHTHTHLQTPNPYDHIYILHVYKHTPGNLLRRGQRRGAAHFRARHRQRQACAGEFGGQESRHGLAGCG